MRILAICYEDPEFILGGMGRHVRELYRELASMGHEIDLLTIGGEGSQEYLGFTKRYAANLIHWKPRAPDVACRMILDIQMLQTLLELVAAGKRWDVIHAHEWESVHLAKVARCALGLPVVGTMHLCISRLMEVENPGSLARMNEWIESDIYMYQQEGKLVHESDEVILCSKAYVEMARRWFIADRPINMIHNGIDRGEWFAGAGSSAKAKRDHGLTLDRPIALYVGRIATMKGIEPLLDAVEHKDGWQVVLAGEVNANDEEAKENWHVTKRIRALEAAEPDRLRWVGFHHGRALKDLYAAADAVLMPSIHEPFGIVALEAMAMGRPLIATEVDGLGEIVVNADGDEFAMIIEPRAEDIAAALDVLDDPQVRDRLSVLGVQRSRDFTWRTAAEKTVAVYDGARCNHARRSKGSFQGTDSRNYH